MKWTTYAIAMLLFSVVGLLLTHHALLRLQGYLLTQPEGLRREGNDIRPVCYGGGSLPARGAGNPTSRKRPSPYFTESMWSRYDRS